MIQQEVGQGRIALVLGDITRQPADAIVTAANAELAGGGGVDGAVHRAAGPELYDACQKLSGCPTGSAVATPAFELEARGVRRVIHAVGPIWRGGQRGEPDQLRGAYWTSMNLARDADLGSIAFPAISAGVYGYPLKGAARVAVQSALDFLRDEPGDLRRVTFVLFDQRTLDAFEEALASCTGP